MWKEFKEFAFKGNIFDLAVAVVIGAAFSKIVTSLVENIITPIIVALTGKINISELHQKIGGVDLTYGLFLQSIIDFLLVSFSIFLVIRFLIKFKKKEEQVEEVIAIDKKEALLEEIRDLLREEKRA